MAKTVNRLELAQEFLAELREQRDDIVGAWVGGSTARGEDTESSDIDMVLLVSDALEDQQRGGIDGWRDGVYVEAVLFPVGAIGDSTTEATLENAFAATHMNHAHILYDATGAITARQEAVRAVYMEPRWLRKRLDFSLDIARKQVGELEAAIGADDPLLLCQSAGHAMWAFTSVALLHAGLSPSSSRGLAQLSAINPGLHDKIAAFEGAAEVGDPALTALCDVFADWSNYASYAARGHAPEYVIKKAQWLAGQGTPAAGLHALWVYAHFLAEDCLAVAKKTEPGRELAELWLELVGWQTPEAQTGKLARAQEILVDLDELVSQVNPV